MFVYEIFIMACKIAGVIVMLPVVLGFFFALVCWGCYLLGCLMIIPFWIADKLTPSKREKRIFSRWKPEEPPPVYSNINFRKEMEQCRNSPKEDG